MAPTEEELSFTDHVARFFAKQYGLPPATGKILGWLFICDPPGQTAAEIAAALQLSRSAVGNAVTLLENFDQVRRARPPGERADRIYAVPASGEGSLDKAAEFGASRALADLGLELLKDEPIERRARLLEMKAFSDFLLERMPAVAVEWRERRRQLRASGELP